VAAFKGVVAGWLGPVDEALHFLAKIAGENGDVQMKSWYLAQLAEFCPESAYLDLQD
jgi:Tfp pilus assembly protein PilF